ncbi:unnamed protein product [Trichobilharzia szidati]|nr:unnamed protein product [Trichobilharzia szidati]
MVSHQDVFKDDIVYYLHDDSKCAFIGSVVMADDRLQHSETENGYKKRDEKDRMVKINWKHFGDANFAPSSLKLSQVHFLDRSYMPGEVVQNLETDTIGTVSNVYLSAHVEILGYQRAIFDVPCSHLRSVYVSKLYLIFVHLITFFVYKA